MPFATRSDLLARSNARRLAQLAIPADVDMVPDDALRVAVTGGDLTVYTLSTKLALEMGLDAIDQALNDADALILSYGIPATVQTTLLARLASTIALYYLQGAERMTEDVRRGYESAIDSLKSHARGDLDLIPPTPAEPEPSGDLVTIESAPARYGASAATTEDW